MRSFNFVVFALFTHEVCSFFHLISKLVYLLLLFFSPSPFFFAQLIVSYCQTSGCRSNILSLNSYLINIYAVKCNSAFNMQDEPCYLSRFSIIHQLIMYIEIMSKTDVCTLCAYVLLVTTNPQCRRHGGVVVSFCRPTSRVEGFVRGV